LQHPGKYIGDLNSHSLEWGYSSADKNGEKLVNWSLVGHKHLVYDAKQGGTFEAGRWGTITSPDLCFVTKYDFDLPLKVNHKVLSKFPKS
jgi:hypothetical protein